MFWTKPKRRLFFVNRKTLAPWTRRVSAGWTERYPLPNVVTLHDPTADQMVGMALNVTAEDFKAWREWWRVPTQPLQSCLDGLFNGERGPSGYPSTDSSSSRSSTSQKPRCPCIQISLPLQCRQGIRNQPADEFPEASNCPLKKPPACATRSRRQARACSTYSPIVPTLIRVWMAPAGQGYQIGFGEQLGCGHVYGV